MSSKYVIQPLGCKSIEYILIKTVDSAFRALWLPTQSVNVHRHSLIDLQFLRVSKAKLA